MTSPAAALPPTDDRPHARRVWIPGDRLTRTTALRHPQDGLRVGVLALQGDVFEHLAALERCGAAAIQVRNADQLAAADGLVLPGGESTTIGKLLQRSGLDVAIRARIGAGMPVFGTCAGMILLADELDQAIDQPRIGGMAVRVRRNAFGRQRASFDTQLEIVGISGGPVDVSFIRAPRVEAVLDDTVAVLATVEQWPVVVAQGPLLAAAFHPEVTGDDRLHRFFVAMVAEAAR